MKIIANIVPVVKLYHSLTYLTKYRKELIAAREAGDDEREREFILKATDTWSNHLVKAFDIQLRVEGRENIPARGPVVFVSNHQGYADILISCAVLNRFQFGFVAKNNLAKVPLYGRWIKDIRSVMIEREDARASLRAINEGIGLIDRGFSLLIFPEGTRSRGKIMNRFRKGSLRLATKSGVPVVPITINGSYRIFEEPGVLREGVSVDFIIHPAIETKDMEKNAANNLSTEVEEMIRGALKRLS